MVIRAGFEPATQWLKARVSQFSQTFLNYQILSITPIYNVLQSMCLSVTNCNCLELSFEKVSEKVSRIYFRLFLILDIFGIFLLKGENYAKRT